MSSIFEITNRVYYSDTDAGGVVYHSKYLDFCEKARTEFLRFKNLIQTEILKNDGILFVVKSANIDYKKSAKLDDLLKITISKIENNGLVIKMIQEVFNSNDELLFAMNIDLVCVNKDKKLVRIPKNIANILNN